MDVEVDETGCHDFAGHIECLAASESVGFQVPSASKNPGIGECDIGYFLDILGGIDHHPIFSNTSAFIVSAFSSVVPIPC